MYKSYKEIYMVTTLIEKFAIIFLAPVIGAIIIILFTLIVQGAFSISSAVTSYLFFQVFWFINLAITLAILKDKE